MVAGFVIARLAGKTGAPVFFSSRLPLRLPASKGPLLSVLALFITDSPAVVRGLRGSNPYSLSTTVPALDGARSLFGVLRPLLVPGRLPVPEDVGKEGNAQSRLDASSGLGDLSRTSGDGIVMFLSIGGREPLLLPERPERTLPIGEDGDADRGYEGARKGLFAASGLIRGGIGSLADRSDPDVADCEVGDLTRPSGGGECAFCNGDAANVVAGCLYPGAEYDEGEGGAWF